MPEFAVNFPFYARIASAIRKSMRSRHAVGYHSGMEIVRNILLVLHFVGLAAIFGGAMTQIGAIKRGTARVVPGIMHGSWLQLASGLLLVAVAEMGDGTVNHAKIGVKLVILIAIVVIALVNKKKDSIAGWVIPTILGLTLVNIVLAVFW